MQRDRKGKGRDLGCGDDFGLDTTPRYATGVGTRSMDSAVKRRRRSWRVRGAADSDAYTDNARMIEDFTRYRSSTRRRKFPLGPLPYLPMLLLAFLTLLSPALGATPQCLRFADYDSINALFTSGGPGTKVHLCPGKVYRLSGPIIFTAADQELATAGYPTDSSRAVLRVQGHAITAIQGDCRRCKGVQIRSVVVDGNRKKLLRARPDEDSTGLVVLGGNEGQVIRDSVLKDPRGYTALHIREGDKLQCKGAQVLNNVIGPVGEEYDEAKDGEDPEQSPLGRPLADGVSIACRDSIIRGNTFIDNTDAAIVIFCSPGSTVENNMISTKSSSAIAGILMVDGTPFDADFSGVQVRRNTIHAEGAPIRIGIGMGTTILSDDTDTILKGAFITENSIKGDLLSYGIAAAGLEDWTIEDNHLEGMYSGKASKRCFEDVELPLPGKMVVHKASVKGAVQPGYNDMAFQYIACIDPLSVNSGSNDGAAPPAIAKADSPLPKPDPVQAAPQPIAADQDDAQHHQAAPVPPIPAGARVDKAKAQADGAVKRAAEPAADTATATPGSQADKAAKGVPFGGVAAAHPPPGTEAREPSQERDLLPFFDTGSTMMDEILEHSLARVLEAIEGLEGKVEMKAGRAPDGAPIDTDHLKGVMGRVSAVEQRQQSTLELASDVREKIKNWAKATKDIDYNRSNALNEIYSHLIHHLLLNPEIDAGELREPPPGWPNPPIPLGETEEFKLEEHERWLKWVAQEELKREKRIALGLESDEQPYHSTGGNGGVGFLFLGIGIGLAAVILRNVLGRYLLQLQDRLGLGPQVKYVLTGSQAGPGGDGGLVNGYAMGSHSATTGGYALNQTNAHHRRRTGSMGAEEKGMEKMVRGWGWGWWGGSDHRKVI